MDIIQSNEIKKEKRTILQWVALILSGYTVIYYVKELIEHIIYMSTPHTEPTLLDLVRGFTDDADIFYDTQLNTVQLIEILIFLVSSIALFIFCLKKSKFTDRKIIIPFAIYEAYILWVFATYIMLIGEYGLSELVTDLIGIISILTEMFIFVMYILTLFGKIKKKNGWMLMLMGLAIWLIIGTITETIDLISYYTNTRLTNYLLFLLCPSKIYAVYILLMIDDKNGIKQIKKEDIKKIIAKIRSREDIEEENE